MCDLSPQRVTGICVFLLTGLSTQLAPLLKYLLPPRHCPPRPPPPTPLLLLINKLTFGVAQHIFEFLPGMNY